MTGISGIRIRIIYYLSSADREGIGCQNKIIEFYKWSNPGESEEEPREGEYKIDSCNMSI